MKEDREWRVMCKILIGFYRKQKRDARGVLDKFTVIDNYSEKYKQLYLIIFLTFLGAL